MSAFFAGLWGKIVLVVVGIGSLLAIFGMIRKGGVDSQKLAQAKTDAVVVARVDAVQPPVAGETSGRLGKGSF